MAWGGHRTALVCVVSMSVVYIDKGLGDQNNTSNLNRLVPSRLGIYGSRIRGYMAVAPRLITRLTAIVGAVLVFGFVFMVVGFFVIRSFEGQPRNTAIATVITALIALLPAMSSYRSTISRERKA